MCAGIRIFITLSTCVHDVGLTIYDHYDDDEGRRNMCEPFLKETKM